ncbi:hypothetical protein MA16_Dca002537 [Dendrobium catenatum]|uniref:Uncharacterized protein n=1 Tax=Dendrobium catenatum TaxID=906689 RepID=A0A2I0W0U1_9ASPA|nr:hypothetical protein MA16_Dca002537 [Dendrobium catenatum]
MTEVGRTVVSRRRSEGLCQVKSSNGRKSIIIYMSGKNPTSGRSPASGRNLAMSGGSLDSSRRAARFDYQHVMFGNRLVYKVLLNEATMATGKVPSVRSMAAGLNPNPNSLYLNIIWIIRTGTDITGFVGMMSARNAVRCSTGLLMILEIYAERLYSDLPFLGAVYSQPECLFHSFL